MRDRMRMRLFHTRPSSKEDPADLPPAPSLSEPERIGRYEVLGRIGSGGMGVIFAALDPALGRKVAVKLLNPSEHRGDSKGKARLLREAQALAKLSHPSIVGVYEVGTFDDQVFIAMEFVEGMTLRKWQAHPDRTWKTVLDAYVAAGQGLAAAHRAGIVHRDFKPDNVLVRRDDGVRVIDFGLARTEESGLLVDVSMGIAAEDSGTPLTRTGTLMGTPAYMAPEQFRGEVTDARTDQFSFCIALYEALYGYRPFAGSNVHHLAMSVLAGRIEAPPRYTDVPEHVFRVLGRGLSPQPEQRYSNLDALLDDLPNGRSRPIRWVIVAFGGLLICGVFGGWLWSRQQQREQATLADRIKLGFEAHRAATAEQEFRTAYRVPSPTRRNQSVLELARDILETDPTEALATLKRLDPKSREWLEAARLLAGEASRQTIEARQLEPAIQDIRMLAITHRANAVAYAGGDSPWIYVHFRGEQDPRKVLHTPKHPMHPIRALDISADGSLIVAGDAGGYVYTWALPDADLPSMPRHRAGVTTVAVAMDGRSLASGSEDGTIHLWVAGADPEVFRRHDGPIRALEFSPDGSLLASAGTDGTGEWVQVSSLRERQTLDVPHRPGIPVRQFAFSAGGRQLHCLGEDGRIFRIQLATRKGELLPTPRDIAQLAYGAASETFAVLQADQGIQLYRSDGSSLPPPVSNGDVTALAMSPDESFLATATDGKIHIFRILPSVDVDWPVHDDVILSLAYSPGGDQVAIGTASGAVRVWSPTVGTKRSLGHLMGGVDELSFAPNGHYLAAIGGRKGISVWDLSTDSASFTFSQTASAEPPLRWSADGAFLAGQICKPDNACSLVVHDVDARTRSIGSAFGPRIRSVELSADGRHVLVIRAGVPPELEFHIPQSAKPAVPPWPDDTLNTVIAHAIEPDGQIVRLATHDAGQLRLWAWVPLEDVLVLLVERPTTQALASTDETNLLIRDGDGDLLWPLLRDWPRPVAELPDTVEQFSLSPTGDVMLLRTHEGGVSLVHTETGITRHVDIDPPFGWSGLSNFVSIGGPSWIRLTLDPTPDREDAFLAWLSELTDAWHDADPVR